jgi:tRNA_anti-like
MKPFFPLGLAIVVISTGACSRSANNPPAATQPAKPVATLTSDELVAEYQKNSLGADQKYKGQYLEVSGKVGKIGKALMGAPFVSLGTGSEEDLFGVTCYLTPASADEAAKLQPGSSVKLRGTCMGQLGGQALRLQDCEFVK